MHSFQPSRARILFEVLCAVVIAASLGGAWIQTGASALLAAAGVATLYSLVHFFDLFRRDPALLAEPQRIDFAADGQADLAVVADVAQADEVVEEVWSAPVELQPLADISVEEPEVVEPAAAPASEGRKPKTSRKNSAGRSTASKKAKPADVAVAEDEVAGPTLAEVAEVAGTIILEPAVPVPHAPLFEPEPFTRMPRQAFGRRGRL